MASIQKVKNSKGFSYRVYIRRHGIKAITKTFPSRKLAVEFSLKVEGDRKMQLAFGGGGSDTTFKDLVDEYLLKGYQGKRPKEQRGKLKYWLGMFNSYKLIDITRRDISNGLFNLSDDLSNATINRYKAAISAVFTYACRELDLPDNPVRHIPSRPENNLRVRYLSNDERGRLFKACKTSRWSKLYLLVLAAITTGARRGELLSLRWDDIDFDRRTAYVVTTKNGQPKVLPLTANVISELSKFNHKNRTLIFNSEIKPDRQMCFTKVWKSALSDADIDNFRFHDLRHTTASYLAQSGASLLEIADVLGHKQISVTKRYAHLCIDHKQQLIEGVMSDL
jgi:integrase